MNKLFKTTALALAASSVALGAVPAEARGHHRQSYSQFQDYQRYGYNDRGYNQRSSYGEPIYGNTRVWRGDNGSYYCRKSDGTTGLIVGAAAGALLGRTVDTRGDRTLGTLLGGVLGGLLGQQVDQGGSRCR